MRLPRISGAVLGLLLALAAPAAAQDRPTRPVTMIVPFVAGGPVDAVARLVAPRMSEIIGQQIIIENIGGAGGASGANRVAKAPPDGSMFLLGNQGTQIFSQLMSKRPLFDARTDFAAIGLVLENKKLLIARKDFPANSMTEFAAYARAHHATMQFGSAGAGSATHIACVLLNAAIGANIIHVPYRGTSPALQDLMAGRIDYMCEVTTTAMPQIQAGTVKPIAILSDSRASALPNLPTALEQGLPDVDVDGWNGFFFPKGTPDAIVQRFAAATDQALDTAAVRERMESFGLTVPPRERRGSAFLGQLVPRELEKWAPPVRASGVSND